MEITHASLTSDHDCLVEDLTNKLLSLRKIVDLDFVST
jgi:hypothetical protein